MIDKDWVECSLGEVLTHTKEKHKPTSIENHFYVGLEHIEKDTGRLTNSVKIDEIKTVKNKFHKGQILYGKLRPYFNKVHLAQKSGVCSTDVLVFQPSNTIVPKFALHFMMSRKFVNEMSSNMSGVNLPRVSTSKVTSYSLNLPPMVIQRAIVAKIEALFSSLDSGIADLKKAQEQLKVYRQSVLKKAFEGELTKEWREKQMNLPSANELLEQIREERQKYYEQQFEKWQIAVRVWGENGKIYRKPIRPVKLTEIKDERLKSLYKINWLMIEMGVLAELIDPQPSHRTPPKVENGIPFISTANFNKKTGEIDFKNARKVSEEVLKDQISLYDIIEGDFIVGKIGTVGKPFFIPSKRFFTLSANLVLIQAKRKICSSRYLFYLIKSNFIQNQFTKGTNSTTQGAFGIKKFRLLKIPTPSIQEQHQIVKEIESRLSVCDQVELNLKESLKKAEALRQSILKKAFEGKLLSQAELAKCKQTKDYEPASVLLERIKAAKETKHTA